MKSCKKITASLLAAVVALALIPRSGLAEASNGDRNYSTDGYFGVGGTILNYSEDYLAEDASIGVITVWYGVKWHENFSGEIRVGFGVTDDTYRVSDGRSSVDVDLSLNNYYGLYVRTGAEAGPFRPYLLAGFSCTELDRKERGILYDSSDSDFSYGFGIEWGHNFFEGQTSVFNVEYINYYEENGTDLTGFTFGSTLYF